MRQFLVTLVLALFAVAFLVLLPFIIWAPAFGPLPTPEYACSAPANWHGLVPGHSNLLDVLRVMGRPRDVNFGYYSDGIVPYLAYPVEGGIVAKYSQDRVYLRRDGVVAWIEVTRADRDGRFHPAGEIVSQLGKALDTVYGNSNYNPATSFYDVLGYEDELYIWSECGMALDVHGTCSASVSGSLECLSAEYGTFPRKFVPTDLSFRHIVHFFLDDVIQANSDNAILMEFLFPSTSYQGFVDYYMYKIPYGQWDEYLRRLRQK